MSGKVRLITIGILLTFLAGAYTGYKFSGRQTASTNAYKNTVKEQENTHTVVTTVTTRSPAGDTKTVETTDSVVTDNKTQLSVDKVAAVSKLTNVSGLAALDFSRGVPTPVYGVSVTRELMGPVTVGAFGLTNGVVGLSVGVSF